MNDIWAYYVNQAISITILSHGGCKSEIPTSDFDEFLPANLAKYNKKHYSIKYYSIKYFCNKKVPYYTIYKSIAWIETGHSYKDAQRAGLSQKLNQQQEREVRQKSSISPIKGWWHHKQIATKGIMVDSSREHVREHK